MLYVYYLPFFNEMYITEEAHDLLHDGDYCSFDVTNGENVIFSFDAMFLGEL